MVTEAVPALGAEQRLVSVVMALPVSARGVEAAFERARVTGGTFGARMDRRADGTIVAAISGRGGARDQAALAARCALALRDAVGSCRMALATGRAAEGAAGLAGDAVNRAAALLAEDRPRLAFTAREVESAGIATDAVTATLVDPHFDVVSSRSRGLLLLGPRDATSLDMPRTLLGRPTPFVGRSAELLLLRGVLQGFLHDRSARAALLVAPSGGGKSRLASELLRAADLGDEVAVWVGRGDPVTAGSPFGMLSRVVRAAADVVDGGTLAARRTKLLSRVSRHLPPGEVQRVAEFLGEFAGIRFPEANNPQLAAARRSRGLMGDQMRRAWGDFLGAECAAHPVILVLEDLHWGDAATVAFVDEALRDLRDRPLLVLALARPEVRGLFPRLWVDHAPVEVHLAELDRTASETFVRAVARADLDEPARRRVVERAGGNPFFLEELVRSAIGGDDQEAPPTVLAMLQSRLERLPPPLRRVLRAASVFGTTFWRGGVEALLGVATSDDAALGTQLGELEARELVIRREHGAFRDEYVFRHALVREAAYATVTEEDRVWAHRAAAIWLERAGETDPMTLAEQFARGGDPRAGLWYVRAAKQALAANDLAGVFACAEAGRAPGTCRKEDVGILCMLQAEAHRWRGEMVQAEACALEALRILPRGTAGWFELAGKLPSAASAAAASRTCR